MASAQVSVGADPSPIFWKLNLKARQNLSRHLGPISRESSPKFNLRAHVVTFPLPALATPRLDRPEAAPLGPPSVPARSRKPRHERDADPGGPASLNRAASLPSASSARCLLRAPQQLRRRQPDGICTQCLAPSRVGSLAAPIGAPLRCSRFACLAGRTATSPRPRGIVDESSRTAKWRLRCPGFGTHHQTAI